MSNLPTEFRGVCWDDGWEFDAPCVIYYPIERYGIGGNSGYIENMVEDYCIDLCLSHLTGKTPNKNLGQIERKEFDWRGWNMRGMCKRKKAYHVLVLVKWSTNSHGELEFEMTKTETQYGKQPNLTTRKQPTP